VTPGIEIEVGRPAASTVIVEVRPAGLVVVHVRVAAVKRRVHAFPFRLFCWVKVARLPPVYVAARVVVVVDDNPDGNVVVTELTGESMPKPGRGSGVCVWTTCTPFGCTTVVDVGPEVIVL
jgi:hypothetical protein